MELLGSDVDRLEVHYEHGTLAIHAPRRPLVPRVLPIERRPAHLINPDAAPC